MDVLTIYDLQFTSIDFSIHENMKAGSFIGQTLDNKYSIERELGKGGMGTVYLATHVGTSRAVAVKVIAPQFMERVEFVERFRREARAAGRLRHPNVVNVTDFGLSDTTGGRVAYLVMEYLDGCTLGEVLEEEKRLPLSWSIDILEQVSSAIQEAHRQGIIHRDLKPDNIWLEPNQRGGYTVKVLDFGIAKLEEHIAQDANVPIPNVAANPTQNLNKETIAENGQTGTIAAAQKASTVFSESATMAIPAVESKTAVLEAGTLIQTNDLNSEGGTAIMPAPENESAEKNAATKLMSAPSAFENSSASRAGKSIAETSQSSELTRVGAVLGTPLYMSPEQCRGEKLSPRSDIYSLAVIAYQMLAGRTPFAGDFQEVMKAHKELAPPALDAKKVPRKVKRIIRQSLAKNPDARPQTAEAFASELRAQSEGIGALLHRAFEIYSKHLPKFLGLSLLLFLPYIFVIILKFSLDILNANGVVGGYSTAVLNAILTLPTTFVAFFCSYLISGATTWIVMQTLAVPLRPVRLRPALEALRRRWLRLTGTGLLSTALTFAGLVLCGLGFPVMSVLFVLVAPVVMMENSRGFASLKRSKRLVMRSPLTTVGAVLIMFLVPALFGGLVSVFVISTVKTFGDTRDKIASARREIENEPPQKSPLAAAPARQPEAAKTADESKENDDIEINVNDGGNIKISGDDEEKNSGKVIAREGLTTLFMLPIQILLAPLSSIIVALLYVKTRLVGGESMQDLLAQFEDADRPRSNWQKRIRKRLAQSGKLTGS